MLFSRTGKKHVSVIEVGARAGAHHERTEQSTRLQIFFAHGARERAIPCIHALRFCLVAASKAMQRGENLIGDLSLHSDQVERSNLDGSARANTLRSDIEKLPIQIEASLRTHKTAC